MTLQITIREATESDLGGLASLNTIFNNSKETTEQIEERLANPQCAEIPIVAEIENQIVGCHFPLTKEASESPGQGGMAMQMNFKSTSDTFRY